MKRCLPFDRTFDFNLCAEKYRRCSTNFKRDFSFFRVMLNVCGIARCNWRMIIFGCTWLCIARFLTCRSYVGTQFIATFNFMLLGHDLLAFNFAFFDTAAAWSAKWKCFSWNFSSTWKWLKNCVQHTLNISTMLTPPSALDNLKYCNTDAERVAAVDTLNRVQPLYFHRHASLRVCIEPKQNFKKSIVSKAIKPTKTHLKITYTAFTDSNAAWFWAWWKICVVPSRWTRSIVASANPCFGFCFWRT